MHSKFGKLAILFSLGFSFAAAARVHPHTCHIIIHQIATNGEQGEIVFDSRLNSKAECAELARLHTPNFTPSVTSQKKVYFKWYR